MARAADSRDAAASRGTSVGDLYAFYEDGLSAMRRATTASDAPYAAPSPPGLQGPSSLPCPPGDLASSGPDPDPWHAFISTGDLGGAPDSTGPLAGATLGVKDNLDVRGFVTTCGSSFYGQAPAARDATVVAELKAAGAHCVGKTNLGEFALEAFTDNPHFGRTLNPVDPERTAGGSSGGSGAAVAARQVALALGTDSAGSVRIPAAACGVVGFKPSAGALSFDGLHGPAWTLDSIGILTRTVPVAHTAMRSLTAHVHAPRTSAARPIGFLADESLGRCHPDVWAVYQRALKELRQAGLPLKPLSLPDLLLAPYACAVIAYVEVSEHHRASLTSHAERYGDAVLPLLELGNRLSGNDYVAAQRVRSRIAASYFAASHSVNAVLTPTLPVAAPHHGAGASVPGDDPGLALFALIRFTCLANLIGLPAVTVPGGRLTDGLPVGIQIMGERYRDLDLLQTAEEIETHLEGIYP